MARSSKSTLLALGCSAVIAGVLLAPALSPSALAGEKSGVKPGAKQTKLVVGAQAPEFKPDTWIKGVPVESFEPGKVYVVEFWATWCPPCRESIPHLTQLQNKHKDDVTIIGMASHERKGKSGTDDRQQKVASFVKDQGDKMNYTVAFEADGQISKLWWEAAEQEGIPAAFIVGGNGKIAWIGNPLDETMEKKLEAAIKAAKASKPANKKPGDKQPPASPQDPGKK